jgi:hypothetical protein
MLSDSLVWWLRTIILATWEAEIGRISISRPAQAKEKKVNETPPIQEKKVGVLGYACHLSNTGGINRRVVVQGKKPGDPNS